MSNGNGHKVSFGKSGSTKTDLVASIKAGVAAALMEAGLPGALSIDLSKAGVNGLTGQLNLKPTISKKDGRTMYNLSGEVTIGGHKVKPMGNWLLPKEGFTVDQETLTVYNAAIAERDKSRDAKRKGTVTEEELEAGETTE